MNDTHQFQQWVRETRKAQGLSMQDCINRVNAAFNSTLCVSAWKNWELRPERQTSRKRVDRIAFALGVSPELAYSKADLVYTDTSRPINEKLPFNAAVYDLLTPQEQATVNQFIQKVYEERNKRK